MAKEEQLLNLDELLPEKHEFVYQDKRYRLTQITVEQFLQLGPHIERLAKAETVGLDEETLNASIEFISLVIPSFPKEKIRGMPLVQVTALFEFINDFVTTATRGKGKKS